MTLEQAKRVIRDEKADFTESAHAATTIASSPDSTFEDLLICLRRNGYTASTAACALYVRTKRPRVPDTIEGTVLDYDDWRNYLLKSGLIER